MGRGIWWIIASVSAAIGLGGGSAIVADETLKGIACRSVHLGYPADVGIALYNEMTIEQSSDGTYFMVCGWDKGYFGMQELANGKKLILFSVWDPGSQNDPNTVKEEQRVKLLHKDEQVRVGRFGNEGTGGQSFFDYDWKIGETYRFCVTARAAGDRSEFAGHFFVPEQRAWKHLVTFSTPTGGTLLKGYYSFVEDFRRNKVSATKTRRARFGHGWVQSATGEWQPLTKARFTADANPVTNIDAGADQDRFFLSTGGDIENKTTKLRELIELKAVPKQSERPNDLPTVAVPVVSDSQVFRKVLRQPGDDGSKAYRIPGLATSPKGTLLAVFDIRHDGAGDLPANIDVGFMRSTDHGETWSSMQRVLDFDQREPNSRGNGVGDPAILVDAQTGTVFVAALWSKGNRAWNGSGPGLTPDETGQLVLAKSTDDGVTWSPPINITDKIAGRDPKWRLLFNGPGSGIQLRDGTLVFAAQFRDAKGTPHSCFLCSRDHGESWTISPAAIPDQPPTSESQIAELADGSLLLTMRDESKSGRRAWSRWTWNASRDDQGLGHWSEPWHTVADPTCMASLIRHPSGVLLFSNPNSPKQRVALTIRTSNDDGKSWSDGRLLDPRGCMYSCLTVLPDGRIGILYEVAGTLTFARFPLDWVSGQ